MSDTTTAANVTEPTVWLAHTTATAREVEAFRALGYHVHIFDAFAHEQPTVTRTYEARKTTAAQIRRESILQFIDSSLTCCGGMAADVLALSQALKVLQDCDAA